jgi:hypothetical protein
VEVLSRPEIDRFPAGEGGGSYHTFMALCMLQWSDFEETAVRIFDSNCGITIVIHNFEYYTCNSREMASVSQRKHTIFNCCPIETSIPFQGWDIFGANSSHLRKNKISTISALI